MTQSTGTGGAPSEAIWAVLRRVLASDGRICPDNLTRRHPVGPRFTGLAPKGQDEEVGASLQPHLTPAIIFGVMGAGALHACWNAIAKQISDRLVAFAWITAAALVLGGAVLVATGLPSRQAVAYAITSAIIHIGYNVGLMRSYRLGAFNQTYPIARGTSPLVVAVGAYFLAGEHLGLAALIGVATLAAGLIVLALSAGRLTGRDLPAVAAAVLTGLTIAAYTVTDGLGVRHAHDPAAYTALLFVLQGPPIIASAAFRRPPAAWRDMATMGRGTIAGLLSIAAYGIVLWAQARAPLAEVAAIRETSVVFAALIGMAALGEDFGRRRVVGAVIVAAGVVLIGF